MGTGAGTVDAQVGVLDADVIVKSADGRCRVRTSWGSASDRGRVRDVNEDALLACPPVFLVADGMGGLDAGAIASRVAVEEFARLAGRPSVGTADVLACLDSAWARLREEPDR